MKTITRMIEADIVPHGIRICVHVEDGDTESRKVTDEYTIARDGRESPEFTQRAMRDLIRIAAKRHDLHDGEWLDTESGIALVSHQIA